VGISGELSLGHAGFMSIGAYTGIVISTWIASAFPENDLEIVRLIAALLSGGITAGFAGVLIGIPVLRLRGDYLAIVTLAFGEIIKSLINCLYASVEGGTLHLGFLLTSPLPGKRIISGPMNTSGIEKLASFGAGFIVVLFTLFVVLNLINSRSGRAIMASRDNRIAAESMGVNVTKYKMMAFVTSAFLAGLAGALYGLNTSIEPKKFGFDTSILVLVFVVLGGIGSIRGSIIAAAALTVLPEILREFGTYRMLVYAIVLIVVMIVRNNAHVRRFLLQLLKSLIIAALIYILPSFLLNNSISKIIVYAVIAVLIIIIRSVPLLKDSANRLLKPITRIFEPLTKRFVSRKEGES